MSVVLAVLTYRRNDQLRTLLPQLVTQARSYGADVRVLVVDNDPDGGAREVVAGASGPVAYVHESRPGISAGRNRALDEAGDSDVLVFIDDDEEPVGDWLLQLMKTYERHGSEAVVGWVESTFARPLDPWVAAGGFFVRVRHPTGTEVPIAATNNLLLDLAAVRRWGLRFDEDFGLAGGSDTLFTRQLVRAGGRIVYCNEAVVTDPVPVDRATRSWVLRRRFRFGNTWSRVELRLSPTAPARAIARVRLLAGGAARIGAGLARHLLGWCTGSRARRAAALGQAARGAGMVLGAFGYVYREYRRPVG